jgi:TolB-like protein
MIRVISVLVLCILLTSCQGTPQPARDLTRLASVKTIYIDDLGKEEGADLIEHSRQVLEEISTGLTQSGRFSVVQSPQEADAVLAGLAGLEKWYHGMEGFYGLEGDLDTSYLGVGRLRLVDVKANQIIWTHDYKRGLLKPTQSVTSRVANQVVEKLLLDATLAAKGTTP